MTLAASSADFDTAAVRLQAAANALGVVTPPPDGPTMASAKNIIVVLADPDGCLLTQQQPDGSWWVTHVSGSRSAPSLWVTLFKGVLQEWLRRGLTTVTVKSTKNSSVAVLAAQVAGGVDKGDHYEFTVNVAATKLGLKVTA